MTVLLPLRSKLFAANRRLASKSASRWWRYLLALLACVSILQLPVPMLHRHTEFESAEVMAEHLGLRHRQSAPPMELSHWHFVMPREIYHDHDCDKDKPTTETGIACLGGASVLNGRSHSAGSELFSTNLASLPIGVQIAGLLTTPAQEAPQQLHPLASLRPTVRLCAVLCVVRC